MNTGIWETLFVIRIMRALRAQTLATLTASIFVWGLFITAIFSMKERLA